MLSIFISFFYDEVKIYEIKRKHNKIEKVTICGVLLALLVVCLGATVSAADYGDIRDMVNNANSEDTINLGSATYTSDGASIRIEDKNLTIRGSSNSNRATLNSGDRSNTFTIPQGSSLTLRYINFVNASSPRSHAITANATVIIENCSFTSCNGDSGAAIYLHEGAINSQIVNCRFIDNHGDNDADNDYTAGGAICVSGADNVEIRNTYFSGNSALNYGGAIAIRNNAQNTRIIGCTFVNNRTSDGGAIYNQLAIGTIISGCTFTNNKVTESGGAIFSRSLLNIIGSSFTGNSAKNGGAIYSTNSLNISLSKFSKNKATSKGGAIYSIISLNITGGTISGNTANYGSGIYNTGTLRLNNVNLISNTAKIISISIQSQSQVIVGDKLVVTSYLTYGDNVANAIYTKNNNVFVNDVRPLISSKTPGKNIILSFNNRQYTAKTNSEGIATFNINIPKTSSLGTFKATVTYKYQEKKVSKFKNVKILSKINNKIILKINNNYSNKILGKVTNKISNKAGKTNTKWNSKKPKVIKVVTQSKKIKTISWAKAKKNYKNKKPTYKYLNLLIPYKQKFIKIKK